MSRRRIGVREQVEAVLDSLHSNVLGAASWGATLTRISDFTGAHCADLTSFNARSFTVERYEWTRMDIATVEKYNRDYVDVENVLDVHPRARLLFEWHEGECKWDQETWPMQQRRRLPYFPEYLWPQGYDESLMGYVRKTDDGRPWTALLIFGADRKGFVSEDTRKRFRMLLPHVRRAICTEEKLLDARRETASLADALDRVGQAVAMIDKSGKLVRGNHAAMALLRHDNGVFLAHDGRVLFADSAKRDEFAKALALCAVPALMLDQPAAGPPAQITVRRFNRGPLVLTLQPLPCELAGRAGPAAILFIADAESRPVDAQAALRSAYGLSPTEARLVQRLREGVSLREFADANRTSYETVRSYVRRIFMKTGARRQSDLIRLAQALR